jgi:hypothetical protein
MSRRITPIRETRQFKLQIQEVGVSAALQLTMDLSLQETGWGSRQSKLRQQPNHRRLFWCASYDSFAVHRYFAFGRVPLWQQRTLESACRIHPLLTTLGNLAHVVSAGHETEPNVDDSFCSSDVYFGMA